MRYPRLDGACDQVADFLGAVAHFAGGEGLEFLADGFDDSVLHAWPRFTTRKARQMSLQQRREALVVLLRQYADHYHRRVTVVFDGYAAKHKPEVAEPATEGMVTTRLVPINLIPLISLAGGLRGTDNRNTVP